MSVVLGEPLRKAVSPYTGIVQTLEECLQQPSEPPLFRVACDVGHDDRLLGAPLDHLAGIGGAGFTRGDAASAAVGEALERYSATFVPHDELVLACARDLGAEAVAPERFGLFTAGQHSTPGFPFVPFDERTRVPWVRGHSLPDQRPAWVPAELVYLVDSIAEGVPRIGYATSSGTACATSASEAHARGLCELLERDAFMIVWANRISLPLLDVAADPELAALDRSAFAVTGLRYAAIDLSVFHRLPSVLGLARMPRGVPGALGVGAGTAAHLARGWWKALSEAFAARAAGVKLTQVDPRTYGPRGAGVRTFEDHIRYYADHGRAEAAAFLDASEERIAVADVPELTGASAAEHVVELCDRVHGAGASAYAVDVTSPDVRELGLHVAKVVAPELCALDVPHAARFLGSPRLYDAPVRLGLRERRLREVDVNPEPHPFP